MTVSPHIAFAPADDPAARADWAVLLNACPTARVHADPRWLEVVSRAFRAPGVFALARDPSGVVSAGVAGYYSRTLRGARVFHSLRHGVLTREPAVLRPLMVAVEAECRSRGCAQSVLGGGPEALPGPYRASEQTTLTLDLAGGPESLWVTFGNKVRNSTRRAERDGLKLDVSRDLAHLNTFHEIYSRAMTERRANVRALPFFARSSTSSAKTRVSTASSRTAGTAGRWSSLRPAARLHTCSEPSTNRGGTWVLPRCCCGMWHAIRRVREFARSTWDLPSPIAERSCSSAVSAACRRRCTTSTWSVRPNRTPYPSLRREWPLLLVGWIARSSAYPSRCVCRCGPGSDVPGVCCDIPPRVSALRAATDGGVLARTRSIQGG